MSCVPLFVALALSQVSPAWMCSWPHSTAQHSFGSNNKPHACAKRLRSIPDNVLWSPAATQTDCPQRVQKRVHTGCLLAPALLSLDSLLLS